MITSRDAELPNQEKPRTQAQGQWVWLDEKGGDGESVNAKEKEGSSGRLKGGTSHKEN